MSTKTMKILVMLVSILLVVFLGTTAVFAADSAALTPGSINGDVSGLADKPDTGEIKNFGNKIMNILQTVGIVLSVVILAVLGLKYLMGSAEEKADFKKAMIPYLVGAAFVFLAPTIANAIYNLL